MFLYLAENAMEVQGAWTGCIFYGKEYGQYAGQTTYFDVRLSQEGDSIQGTSWDIGGIGVNPDPASISGETHDQNITFIKRYSSYHYYDKGVTSIDNSRPGPEIKYSGKFDKNQQCFEGVWVIKGVVKLFWLIPIKYTNKGTWSMKRKG